MYFTSPSLAIVDHPADAKHRTIGRAGQFPQWIVIHHTGGDNSLNWLSTTSAPPVSCHRLISKVGVNYKIVQDKDTAYCAGYAVVGPIPSKTGLNLNYYSLNIELENRGTGTDEYPFAQMQMCANQVVEWWAAYGFLPVVGHGDVDSGKNDPLGFDWSLLYRLIKDRLSTCLVLPA